MMAVTALFKQVVLAPIAVGMLANKYLNKAVQVTHTNT
jgi:hypothetical protein